MEVENIKFFVTSIYDETNNDKNYLFVNYTLEYYHKNAWIPDINRNKFYMAYNKTLNFLNWSTEGCQLGNLFLFPTPVNFSLIGEAIIIAGIFKNYSISGEKIVLDYENSTTIELTIDSSGISTIIERITNGTTIYRWELNTDLIIIKVPFGNYYLIVLIISVMSLVIVKKKKMLKAFKH
jgi:hypothetical protein